MTTGNIATFDRTKEKNFAAMKKYFAPMFVFLIYVTSCNVPLIMCKTVFSDKDLHTCRQVLQKQALNDFLNSLMTTRLNKQNHDLGKFLNIYCNCNKG